MSRVFVNDAAPRAVDQLVRETDLLIWNFITPIFSPMNGRESCGPRGRGCFLDLNAHPDRLDLSDIHCRAAKAEGVLVSINSDAHRIEQFANLRFGVGQARRGWLEQKDVLNARPLSLLRRILKATM